MKKLHLGFTLIELMITVVIIGILASIAYPSYVEQVRKTRRANAQSDLVELASFMERHYTEKFSYGAVNNAALPIKESPKSGSPKYYTLTVISSDTSYALTATAKNGQDSDRCGDLTLNHIGTKSAAITGCW
jgi:type IV pilus assembly protein PilE